MIFLGLVFAQAAMTLTLEQARGMAPQELAATVLGAGHGAIANVQVLAGDFVQKKDGLTGLTFLGVPGPAPGRQGWCRQIITGVWLVPVDPHARLGASTPTRVDKITTSSMYRLAAGDCAATEATYFQIRSEADQIALMERMVAARTLARGSDPLPFALTCKDEDGGRPGMDGDRCIEGAGRGLLANLPLEKAFQVVTGPAYIWNGSDRPATPEPHDAEIWMDDGFHIDATIAEKDGRISAITLRRHVPAPP